MDGRQNRKVGELESSHNEKGNEIDKSDLFKVTSLEPNTLKLESNSSQSNVDHNYSINHSGVSRIIVNGF